MEETIETVEKGIVLTHDQQVALDMVRDFLNSDQERMIIAGYAGCGKSTLVKEILKMIESWEKVKKLIMDDHKETPIKLTATTNKAAENLSNITDLPVTTIYSLLGLRVDTDFRTGITSLNTQKARSRYNEIIIIDEAFYMDKEALQCIERLTKTCKVIYVGDSAQFAPIGYKTSPLDSKRHTRANLTKVVRHEGPIQELATQLRNTVNTGEWSPIKVDGSQILHLDADDFTEMFADEFTRGDWKYQDSKVLAWTNKKVIEYNHYINELVKGVPHFQKGDYAIVNSFFKCATTSFKTDQMVHVDSVSEKVSEYGVGGTHYVLDGHAGIFMPDDIQAKAKLLKQFRLDSQWHTVRIIEETWVDLRAAYAQTANKAQGSTYKRVFIDLNDIKKCRDGNQLARMMYVAVSRAKEQVIFTGDLV